MRSRWLSIDLLRRRPGCLPGVRRVTQDALEVGPATRDHIATNVHVKQRCIDVVVVGVRVWRVVVEDNDQVEVALWTGVSLGPTTKKVDAERLQAFSKSPNDCSESLLLGAVAAVVGWLRTHVTILACPGSRPIQLVLERLAVQGARSERVSCPLVRRTRGP